jgi:hypothetical protein
MTDEEAKLPSILFLPPCRAIGLSMEARFKTGPLRNSSECRRYLSIVRGLLKAVDHKNLEFSPGLF